MHAPWGTHPQRLLGLSSNSIDLWSGHFWVDPTLSPELSVGLVKVTLGGVWLNITSLLRWLLSRSTPCQVSWTPFPVYPLHTNPHLEAASGENDLKVHLISPLCLETEPWVCSGVTFRINNRERKSLHFLIVHCYIFLIMWCKKNWAFLFSLLSPSISLEQGQEGWRSSSHIWYWPWNQVLRVAEPGAWRHQSATISV